MLATALYLTLRRLCHSPFMLDAGCRAEDGAAPLSPAQLLESCLPSFSYIAHAGFAPSPTCRIAAATHQLQVMWFACFLAPAPEQLPQELNRPLGVQEAEGDLYHWGDRDRVCPRAPLRRHPPVLHSDVPDEVREEHDSDDEPRRVEQGLDQRGGHDSPGNQQPRVDLQAATEMHTGGHARHSRSHRSRLRRPKRSHECRTCVLTRLGRACTGTTCAVSCRRGHGRTP